MFGSLAVKFLPVGMHRKRCRYLPVLSFVSYGDFITHIPRFIFSAGPLAPVYFIPYKKFIGFVFTSVTNANDFPLKYISRNKNVIVLVFHNWLYW
jgi:hypothetical protein